jgi:putative holliday junction resolvase
MRILGIDFGDRRIGVAMCDPEQILASPVITIIRDDDEQAIGEIKSIIDKNKIGLIVMGIPYSLSGNESTQTARTRDFAGKLESATGLQVAFQDERLSSWEAQRLISSTGQKKDKNRPKGALDSAVAAMLLQSYIDMHKTG